MALPELQSEAVKWQRRLASLGNAGLNTQPALQLARTDMSRIAQGGSALSEDQVVSMVYSAYTGHTPVAQNQNKGTDWNPFHIVGNAMSDASHDVRDFVPMMAREGQDIVNPSKWEALFKDIPQFKFGSISDMAKEVQAMPIVGPLVPGMFAASAGTSGMTQHPLNFLLDVGAVASLGTKLATMPMEAGAEGSMLEALQNGHPVQAVAKATGLEDRLITAVKAAGAAQPIADMAAAGHYTAAAGLGLTPLKNSQWAYMPVWRAYNALARLNTRALRDKALNKLDDIGIGPNDLSLEERQQLSIDAQEFSDRFLAPSEPADPAQIARANGDVRTAFSGVTGDVSAFTTIDPAAKMESPLYWSEQSAKDAIPQGIDLPTYNVRVKPSDITYKDGRYYGTNTDPNKFYTHDEADVLAQIRKQSQEFDPRTTAKDSPQSVMVPGPDGNILSTELYPRDSLPVRAQAKAEAAQNEVKTATAAMNKALARKEKLDNTFDKVVAKHKAGQATDAEAIRANKARTDHREKLKTIAKNLQTKRDAAERANKQFNEAIAKSPSSRMGRLTEGMVRSRLKQRVKSQIISGTGDEGKVALQGAGIAAGLDQLQKVYDQLNAIDNAKSREELASVVGEDTFKAVEEGAYQDWRQLIASGYNPIWIHQIDPAWYDAKTFASVRPLAYELKAKDRDIIFDMKPQVLDIHAQLTGQAIEYWRQEATRQFMDFLVSKSGVVQKTTDIEADLQKRFPDSWTQVAKHAKMDYVKWDNPHDPTTEYMIPRGVQKGLDTILDGDGKIPFKAMRDRVHRTFRVAVLSGPRHLVHVALGGLVQTALQEPGALLDPEVLAHPIALMRAMKSGELPKELHDYQAQWAEAMKSGQLSKGMHEQSIDQLVAYRGGSRLGQWFAQSMVGHGVHQLERVVNNFEANMTDWYRAAVYLHKMRGGADNEAALAVVNKALIDVDNMTPFERTAIRQVFPFWTFTKHILRYVLTYPADHPLRASILAHLAQNLQETNNSGDPGRLSKLFFLGSPDASGKVNTVDFSNLNPFRSMSSVFSMAGFLQGLSPEYQVALRAFGINTLTGAPSLHQNYTYDAYSGTRKTTRPPLNPFDFASAFIPQVEIIDHFVQFTDTMRYLKQNDPEAYRRSLLQEMNFPFTVAPINIYDVRAKAAAAQYKMGSDAVTNAMRTGNTSAIRSFLAVPFQGQLYDAQQVANYIDNFDKIYPQFAPSSVMRKPRTTKRAATQFSQDTSGLPSQPTLPTVTGYG